MSKRDVINFLKIVSQDSSLQEQFRVKNEEELMLGAKNLSYNFTEEELANVIWEMEKFIADKRGEKFDATFSLWRTMWGKYYFQFVLENVFGSLSERELEETIGG